VVLFEEWLGMLGAYRVMTERSETTLLALALFEVGEERRDLVFGERLMCF